MPPNLYELCARGALDEVERLFRTRRHLTQAAQSHGPLGETPLHAACDGGHEALVQLLLQKLPSHAMIKSIHGKTALHAACEAGHVACAMIVLKSANEGTLNHADAQGCTALMRACIGGHAAIVSVLVEHTDCDIDLLDSAGMTAMYRACVGGHLSCVTLLLRAGACLQPALHRFIALDHLHLLF